MDIRFEMELALSAGGDGFVDGHTARKLVNRIYLLYDALEEIKHCRDGSPWGQRERNISIRALSFKGIYDKEFSHPKCGKRFS